MSAPLFSSIDGPLNLAEYQKLSMVLQIKAEKSARPTAGRKAGWLFALAH
jgi:hypothetical protein